MTHSKVSIKFTSLASMWAFRMEINANIFEMNVAQLTIKCDCSEEHIKLAIEKYNGKIVEALKEGLQPSFAFLPSFLRTKQ